MLGVGVIHAIDVSHVTDATTTFHPTRCALGGQSTAVMLRLPDAVEASAPAQSSVTTVRRLHARTTLAKAPPHNARSPHVPTSYP